MNQKDIDRINELYRKAKSVGLTEEEAAEQALLRKNYIASFKANLRGTLNNIKVQNPDGTIVDLSTKDKNGSKENN
ncbi:MAG: DUF896 domain-containing protein [Lachnospiraceae bacterium]|nr:DUF896 domain-containing protein [Lachnospira sp.]MBQ8730142.1 DUF896 domain-containing protein [Lachnospiraceae bacterium]MBR6698184.1 DUF896 domain-containing protein [Lachnospiraceae bacterium]